MPDTGYVKKSSVRFLVIGMFVFLLVVVALGLTLVKNYAADEAATRATAVALQANDAQRYATNRATCGLRGLVDPLIASDRLQLKSYKKAAADKSLSKSARARNETRIASTVTAIDGLVKFRAVYATIPPDFDCKTLPNHPPYFNPKG